MKRQIKFRGKRVDTGEWVIGCLVGYHQAYYDGNSNRVCIDSGILTTTEVTSDTVGQFTGLLDKNGKEIYEGDVVKASQNEILGVIKWDKHRLCFLCEWTNMPTAGDIEYLINYCDLEVIGNVIDNPELLKGGEQ